MPFTVHHLHLQGAHSGDSQALFKKVFPKISMTVHHLHAQGAQSRDQALPKQSFRDVIHSPSLARAGSARRRFCRTSECRRRRRPAAAAGCAASRRPPQPPLLPSSATAAKEFPPRLTMAHDPRCPSLLIYVGFMEILLAENRDHWLQGSVVHQWHRELIPSQMLPVECFSSHVFA